jgi:hypothetical protein
MNVGLFLCAPLFVFSRRWKKEESVEDARLPEQIKFAMKIKNIFQELIWLLLFCGNSAKRRKAYVYRRRSRSFWL